MQFKVNSDTKLHWQAEEKLYSVFWLQNNPHNKRKEKMWEKQSTQ